MGSQHLNRVFRNWNSEHFGIPKRSVPIGTATAYQCQRRYRPAGRPPHTNVILLAIGFAVNVWHICISIEVIILPFIWSGVLEAGHKTHARTLGCWQTADSPRTGPSELAAVGVALRLLAG